MKRRKSVISVVATSLKTPIGPVSIKATPLGVRRIVFGAAPTGRGEARAAESKTGATRSAQKHLDAARRQLREYFAGRRSRFELALDLEATAFERCVWRALLKIPFGNTQSYRETAARLGTPGAARAVGRACAANPVPVVVPCHRVVGSDARLHGYGGGLWRKRLLLELENQKSA
jgi:O-6-methylguanine DNA methyltransferase